MGDGGPVESAGGWDTAGDAAAGGVQGSWGGGDAGGGGGW